MTAADFADFVVLCKERHHWSKANIAKRLGCGINQIKRWSENDPPRYIALACAALLHDLPPWSRKND